MTTEQKFPEAEPQKPEPVFIETDAGTPLRVPFYLSFSGMTQFFSDRDEYFLRYIAKNRPPRAPQGEPASVGSAFDARVKSELYERYYGAGYKPEKYSFEALFLKQVDEERRDFARDRGIYVYESYVKSGMYKRFTDVFDLAVEPPKFEFKVQKTVGGVPFLGLPDGHAKLASGRSVIADWKVNGFCSKSNTSPNKGYAKCLDGYTAKKPSKSHEQSHKEHVAFMLDGIEISEHFMEDVEEKWASQTTGYGWCLDCPVGNEDTIYMIHQCVAKPLPSGAMPLLRFADFRARTRKPFQEMLMKNYQRVWKAVSTGHIYDEMSKQNSDKEVARMHDLAEALYGDESEHAEFYSDVIRPDWFA
jgi:hypothetical protein